MDRIVNFDFTAEEEAAAMASVAPNGDYADLPPTPESNWKDLCCDAADIVLKDIPPVVQVIQSIVCEQSKLVLGSGSKSYKTWLTMDMALSVSHGYKIMGKLETTRCRTLYVNLELKPSTFERRLQAIAKAKGLNIEPGWFIHLPLRGKISTVVLLVVISRLIRLCQDKKITCVVLDPVAMLNTAGDENSSRDQILLMNEIDRLTTEAGVTVLLNDHFGKGNQSEKDPLDAIRGSSAKGGALDAAMILRRHDVEDCFRVDLIHRELPPVEPFVIGWNYPLMEFRPDLDPEEMKKVKGGRPKEYEAFDLLEPIRNTSIESSITITAWSKILGIKRDTLSSYLPALRKQDFIRTTGEGTQARQYITEKGGFLFSNES